MNFSGNHTTSYQSLLISTTILNETTILKYLQVHLFTYVVGTPFECKVMNEFLRNNLDLFQDLSYKKMKRFLVTYGVLTDEEQSQIDHWNRDEKDKIRGVIINITNNLLVNKTSQLKGFLQLLEEDSDPDFKEAAKRLG